MAYEGTTRTADRGPEVLVALRRDGGPLRAQVEHGLRELIRTGGLAEGERLPPSRALASDLGVSRRLISDAYEQLRAEGWLDSRSGVGTWVAVEPSRHAAGATATAPVAPRRPRYDFFPGAPDLAGFPRAAWTRALRDAVRTVPDAELGYGDPRGPYELRRELAAYLRRARGLDVDPNAVVVCSGTMQAVSLLGRVLVGAGRGRIAVEEPSLPVLTGALEHAGAQLVRIAVDEDGLDVAALRVSGASAVLVTPAHQFPTGVPLATARRGALVEWASAARLVIEDDYNAEFRYDRPALGALQALAPDRVAHVGTVSKTLAPGLRLGWLVPPAHLLGDLLATRIYADGGPPTIECLALARLLAAGDYDRHLRAARRRYRLRRAALADAVGRELPDSRLTGLPGGLHAPLELPTPVDAAALAAAALERDVGVHPLVWFSGEPSATTRTLVLGYGNLAEPALAEGVRRLADALRAVSSRRG